VNDFREAANIQLLETTGTTVMPSRCHTLSWRQAGKMLLLV
jgi:hypothetical protein